MKKICKDCNIEKNIDEFRLKYTSGSNVYLTICKDCERTKKREHYQKNAEKLKLKAKEYKQNNKDKINEYQRERYTKKKNEKEINERKIQNKKNIENKLEYKKKYTEYYKNYRQTEKYKLSKKTYRENNKEIINEWRENNKEKLKEYRKNYYEKNKDIIREKNNSEKYKLVKKLYYEKNKDKRNEWRRTYQKNRLSNDPLFKLRFNISNSIRLSYTNKGYKKNSKTQEILGCTFEEFKIYLESKFEPWMTYDNYGKYNGELNYGWDIDHIIPICSATTEAEVIKLNHYTNLQPLCSKINRDIKKHNY